MRGSRGRPARAGHTLQRVRTFHGELGTRFAWLRHGIFQETDHRGQLALCQRLMGPAPTCRIRGGEG